MPIAPIVSTFPSTQFEAMPQIDVEWAPTSDPMNAPVWTTFASRVHNLSTRRGRSSELEQYQAGKLSVLCDSIDRLLDPNYTAGPWYGNVLPNRQVRVSARWAGTTYDVVNAFTDGWPQQYEMNTTKVALEATDGFKMLAANGLMSAYDVQIRTDQPTHWWPMSESVLGGGLTVKDAGYGTAQDGTLSGTAKLGGPVIRQGAVGSATGDVQGAVGPLISASTSALPPAASTLVSWEFWYQMKNTDGSSGTATFCSLGSNSILSGTGIILSGNASNGLDCFLVNAGSIVGSVTVANACNDTNPHHVVVTYSGTNTRWRVYFDGALSGTDSTGIPASLTMTTTAYFFFAGGSEYSMSDFQQYNGVEMTSTTVLTHYNAGFSSFSGEDTGTRVGRILDQTAWPTARRTIDTGDVNVGSHDWSTSTALDYLQKLAQTERAEFYMETNGNVVWRNRSALTDDTRSNTSQATFGDSGSELPYSAIEINYDEVQIRNSVTITRDGGLPQMTEDTTSIEKYGKHTYSESGSFDASDTTAAATAATILAKYKDPKLRITGITIDPGNDPTNLFPQVLGRKIGDRITVVRRPQNVGSAISQDCWIEGIDHDVTNDRWITKFQLVAVS